MTASKVAAVAEPSRSTGFAKLLGRGGAAFPTARKLEAYGCAGIGAEDSQSPGVREHADTPAARQRLAREQSRCVDELLERPRPNHAGLAEERLDGGIGAGKGGRVGARGACACLGRARLQREQRFPPRDPPREAGELLRVAEGLEVKQDELGFVIVLPPLEQIVRGDVGLVADRHERREAEAPLRSLLEQRQPERAALRRERDRAGRQRPRAEGRVEPEPRHRDPEAVRADEPAAVCANEAEQALLALAALGADLGEAGRDDAERLDAAHERGLGSVEHVRPRQADDCEVDDLGDITDRLVRRHAAHRLAVPVDRVRRAGEVRRQNVSEQLAADRAPAARGADHSDRLRLEERAEGGRDGEVVALVDAGAVPLRRRDREANFELAAVELPRHLEAGALEDAEHRPVLRHHLRDEALDPLLGRERREPLEQSRPDSPALQLVGDRESRLGGALVA